LINNKLIECFVLIFPFYFVLLYFLVRTTEKKFFALAPPNSFQPQYLNRGAWVWSTTSKAPLNSFWSRKRGAEVTGNGAEKSFTQGYECGKIKM